MMPQPPSPPPPPPGGGGSSSFRRNGRRGKRHQLNIKHKCARNGTIPSGSIPFLKKYESRNSSLWPNGPGRVDTCQRMLMADILLLPLPPPPRPPPIRKALEMKLECDHVSQVTSTSTSMASGRESNWQRRCCPQAPSDHGLILIMTIINPMQLQGRSDEAAESSGFPHRKLTGSPARPPPPSLFSSVESQPTMTSFPSK